MKLYDVNRNTKIRLLEDARVPVGHRPVLEGEIIDFDHIDGMYSLGKDENGQFVHIAAFTEVEVIE